MTRMVRRCSFISISFGARNRASSTSLSYAGSAHVVSMTAVRKRDRLTVAGEGGGSSTVRKSTRSHIALGSGDEGESLCVCVGNGWRVERGRGHGRVQMSMFWFSLSGSLSCAVCTDVHRFCTRRRHQSRWLGRCVSSVPLRNCSCCANSTATTTTTHTHNASPRFPCCRWSRSRAPKCQWWLYCRF
jgi:hypothetical protein